MDEDIAKPIDAAPAAMTAAREAVSGAPAASAEAATTKPLGERGVARATPAPAKVKPMRFVEQEEVTTLRQMVVEGKAERAVDRLLELLPAIATSKVNRKDRFAFLSFVSKFIQGSGTAKHGYRKLLSKVANLERHLASAVVPEGGSFVDLGCGAHDPLALSTYYYANGFRSAHAYDLLAPRHPMFSALAMYDLLANMRLFPERYCRNGVSPETVLARIGDFDVEAFEAGDLERGLRNMGGKVTLDARDLVQGDLEPGSVSLLVSFAVLEHVSDLPGVSSYIYRLLKPGGVAFHFVDLADHRSYRADSGIGPLGFLCEETAPPHMNRIRAPQQLAAQREAGFEILSEARQKVVLPEGIRANLIPRFADLSDDDLATIGLTVVLRKPASV
jgi:SAM-dependent methyltransferase